jgi:hypothetical protein
MVLSKIYLAFLFAVNVAAMAINPSAGIIHERDGDLFISHTLPDGSQKVQYLSEYEETTPTTDCRAMLADTFQPANPQCPKPGNLVNPFHAEVAQKGLAMLCGGGTGLTFSGDITFYFKTAFAFVGYLSPKTPGICTFTTINAGIDEVIKGCGQDKKGHWIDDKKLYIYGRFDRGDYSPPQ